MPETTQEIEFTCPRCGGSAFGSSAEAGQPAHGKRVYHCKGSYRGSCPFKWHSDDYWRYVQLVTRRAFASNEEFERVHKELSNGSGNVAVVP